ncbi:MAG: protein translocase subunit SecDF, partial [Bacteroidales bacterium]
MQNKGAIRLLALLMAVVCIYQLSFSVATWRIEKAAKTYAQGDLNKEMSYLDSMGSEVAYNFFYLRKYTYKECVDREIILGLDLKGGMNVILEVQVADVVRALSNYSTDPIFTQAITLAKERQKENSRADFITLFGEAFEELDPNAKLASIFNTVDLRDRISFSATNKEVLDFLRAESEVAVSNSFNIIRSRIDRFGVVSPNVQRLEGTGRILVEMPGVTEPERVRKLLQGTANLQFWETYENAEVYPSFVEVNRKLAEIQLQSSSAVSADSAANVATPAPELAAAALADSASQAVADTSSLLAQLETGNALADSLAAMADAQKNFPLFSILSPSVSGDQLIPGSVVGLAHYRDTAQVSAYLNDPRLRSLLPRDLFFLWSAKAYALDKTGSYFELHAIKRSGRDGRPPLDGGVITNAAANYSQMGGSAAEVS